jgi:hypothetical protein
MRLIPTAAPVNSARSVAIATISACSQSITLARRPNRSRHSSGRLRPVHRPALVVRYCTRMAIRLAITMTRTSSYPCSAPPAKLAAKFPGST